MLISHKDKNIKSMVRNLTIRVNLFRPKIFSIFLHLFIFPVVLTITKF